MKTIDITTLDLVTRGRQEEAYMIPIESNDLASVTGGDTQGYLACAADKIHAADAATLGIPYMPDNKDAARVAALPDVAKTLQGALAKCAIDNHVQGRKAP